MSRQRSTTPALARALLCLWLGGSASAAEDPDGPPSGPTPAAVATAAAAAEPETARRAAPAATPAAEPSTASAPDGTPRPRRGPLALPDLQLLAQPRFTLAATSPETLARGRTSLDAVVVWGNSFSWSQDRRGETPALRRYLVDGEAVTALLAFERGLGGELDLALRLPLHWRGGGTLDPLIDAWHRLLDPLGIDDGQRPTFDRNRFRVEGRGDDAEPFSWTESGAGLGDLQLRLRRHLAGGGRGTSVSALAHLTLPTGTGPFAVGGVAGGLQVVSATPLGGDFDVYLSAGLTGWTEDEIDGVAYETWRGHGGLALEWRPGRSWSLVAQADYATRLVAEDAIDRYPGTHLTLSISGLVDVGARQQLVLGFTENLKSQGSTVDVAFHLGWRVRP